MKFYTFDAAAVLRAAVERGAGGREAVVGLLGTLTVPGVTGIIQFDGSTSCSILISAGSFSSIAQIISPMK